MLRRLKPPSREQLQLHKRTWRTCTLVVSLVCGLPLFSAKVGLASETEKPKDLIAEQIRRQGFECKNPQSAERDQEASKPNETVWTLTCENAAYRVTLIPSMAAEVKRLD